MRVHKDKPSESNEIVRHLCAVCRVNKLVMINTFYCSLRRIIYNSFSAKYLSKYTGPLRLTHLLNVKLQYTFYNHSNLKYNQFRLSWFLNVIKQFRETTVQASIDNRHIFLLFCTF